MEIKYIYAIVEILGAFLCLIEAGYLTVIRSIIKEQNRALAVTELAVGVMLFSDGIAWYYRGVPGHGPFIILNISNYTTIACNAILPMFLCVYLVRSIPKEARNPIIINIIGVYAAFLEIFLIFCHTNNYIFRINAETNLYQRGRGFIVWSVLNIIPILLLIGYAIYKRKNLSKGRFCAVILFTVLPLLTITIQSFIYGLSLTNFSVMLCALIMTIQATQENLGLLLQQQKDLALKEVELADMRNRIALSQIKPHFLYNTLNSIYVLCDEDKEKAKEVINNLSDYLRGNLGSIESKEPIPFEKELEHTRVYIELEKVRFTDRFDVEYDIEATNFSVPALTIQPLAENAIKHGLCKKKREDKGLLRISSRDCGDYYSVCIEDNGIGFDVDEYNSREITPGMHIGLRNVRERIKLLEKADLFISSEKGKGTKIEMRIPK